MEKLHLKFSALNVDFNVQASTFYVQKNLHTTASESGTP